MQQSNSLPSSSPTMRFTPYPTLSLSRNQLQYIASQNLAPSDGPIQSLQLQRYFLSLYHRINSNPDYFSQVQNSLQYYQELAYIQQKYGPTFPQAPAHQELELESRETSYSTDSASEVGEEDGDEVSAVAVIDRKSESAEDHPSSSQSNCHAVEQTVETEVQAVDCSSQITTPSDRLLREVRCLDLSSSADSSADSTPSQSSDSGTSSAARYSICTNIPSTNKAAKWAAFKGRITRTAQLHPKKLFLRKYEKEQEEEELKQTFFQRYSSNGEASKRLAGKTNDNLSEPRRSRRSRRQPSRFEVM